MKKRYLIWLVSIFLLLSSAVSNGTENKPNKPEDYYDNYERLVRVVKVILEKYVDDVDINDLFHDAYKGMLDGLDSYSQYFSPEDLEDLKIETEGEFEGLGIEVVIKDGMLVVITPIIDSPAMRAGILAGDIILKIDDQATENLTFREVIKGLRGKLGTEVTLTVLHKSQIDPVAITIKRAKVQVKSVRGARIVDEKAKIGYLAITNFQDHTVEDLDIAVKDLKKQEMKSLILDLRFNPGGLLKVAIDVSDQFLEEGIIVSTKSRDVSQNVVYNADKHGSLKNYPLVVLINNGSASASEIVAGAIKDNKRGLLLGTKTFGKGSVQSLLPIEDGKSALKLTTARYYTPSGVSIHGKGIEPDINVELTFDEMKQLHEHLSAINVNIISEDTTSENSNKDSPILNDYKDKQLQNAINILKSADILKK